MLLDFCVLQKSFCHRKEVSNLNFKCFRLHTRTTLPTLRSAVSLGSVSSTSLMSSGKNRQVNLNIMLSLSMMILFDIWTFSKFPKKHFFRAIIMTRYSPQPLLYLILKLLVQRRRSLTGRLFKHLNSVFNRSDVLKNSAVNRSNVPWTLFKTSRRKAIMKTRMRRRKIIVRGATRRKNETRTTSTTMKRRRRKANISSPSQTLLRQCPTGWMGCQIYQSCRKCSFTRSRESRFTRCIRRFMRKLMMVILNWFSSQVCNVCYCWIYALPLIVDVYKNI